MRYFRGGEIDNITAVETTAGAVRVELKVGKSTRTDRWKDLGGGIGYVPDDSSSP